tara:strand:- start:634 stop:813 length:180 start_codon:yes stop_codon:yes gene_type:complete
MPEEAAEGQQITPHLKMGEEFYIEDKDDKGVTFKKMYRIVQSGKVDGRSFYPIASLKVV